MPRVEISKGNHELLNAYCNVTKKNLPQVLDDLIFEWCDTVGAAEMQSVVSASAFLRRTSAKVIEMRRKRATVIPIRPRSIG